MLLEGNARAAAGQRELDIRVLLTRNKHMDKKQRREKNVRGTE